MSAEEAKFSRFLIDLAAPCDLIAFPARAARLLGELIPCMASGYGLRDTRTGVPDGSVGLAEIEYQADEKRFLVDHIHELPYIDLLGPVASDRPRASALCSSDFYSARQFRDLAVYQEVFGPRRIRYQMVLPTFDMGPLWVGGFGMQREDRDFTTEERALYTRARPHLIEAARTAALFNLAQNAKEVAALILDRRGEVLMGAALLPLIERYWGRAQGGLPYELRAWLARALDATNGAIVKRAGQRTLTIRRCLDPDHRLTVLLVREEHAGVTALTTREREVADWISQGLSNREVGEILGISQNTVKRHIAAVFLKMEIDNRTELARAIAPVLGLRSV